MAEIRHCAAFRSYLFLVTNDSDYFVVGWVKKCKYLCFKIKEMVVKTLRMV